VALPLRAKAPGSVPGLPYPSFWLKMLGFHGSGRPSRTASSVLFAGQVAHSMKEVAPTLDVRHESAYGGPHALEES
jgi:hypothetical protein